VVRRTIARPVAEPSRATILLAHFSDPAERVTENKTAIESELD
jgi:hypothetical protein